MKGKYRKQNMSLLELVDWCFLESKLGGPNGDCWIWDRSLDSNGYPTVGYNGKIKRISRLVLIYLYGEQPGKVVRHVCDNKNCISPYHIEWASYSENKIDVSYRGQRHQKLKLHEHDIIEIREMLNNGVTQQTIADRFGVGQNTISRIKTGYIWSHVTT